MTWHRIWTLAYSHLIQFPGDFNRIASVVYWPFIDIALFGFTGAWLAEPTTQEAAVLLAGVSLWQMVARANYGVSLNLLHEIWSHNITNLFTTPISLNEWVAASILEGGILLSITALFCITIVWGLYSVNLFALLGWWLLPFSLIILYAGASVGLISASFLLWKGKRIQTIVFMISWLFAPISGAFYPVNVLPFWLQKVAYSLPFYYLFNAIATTVKNGSPLITDIITATGLTCLYFLASFITFRCMFRFAQHRGLHHLTD